MTKPAPTAFVGSLGYAWPGVTGTPALAHIELAREDYDPLLRTVGFPRSPGGPNVAVMACGTPVHPVTHVDVLTEALARGLADLLDARAAPPTPGLRRQLQRLAPALARSTAGGGDRPTQAPCGEL